MVSKHQREKTKAQQDEKEQNSESEKDKAFYELDIGDGNLMHIRMNCFTYQPYCALGC